MKSEAKAIVFGTTLSNAILLIYGLFRPESLEFSIPFLIAPSLALLGTAVARDPSARRPVLSVIWGVVLGLIIVILINEFA